MFHHIFAYSGETTLKFLYLCRTVLLRSPTGKEHLFLQQTQSFYFRPSFITTDGLYRICGAHSDVQMIKQEIDKVLSSPPHPSYPSLWPLSDLRATLRSCLPLKVFTLWLAPSNSSWGSFQSQWFLGRCSLKSRSILDSYFPSRM